jgi:hypothetical protein
MSNAESSSRLSLLPMVIGAVAALPAIFVGGETSAIFLLPAGLAITATGLMVAMDYRGAVNLFMKLFWFDRTIPLIQGRWQMRVIGAVMCVVGTALAVGGFLAVLDALGVIDHEIEG